MLVNALPFSFSLHRLERYTIKLSIQSMADDVSKQSQRKTVKARAAAILRAKGMPEAEIAVSLGVTVRALQLWRRESAERCESMAAQVARFDAACMDLD